MNKQYIITVLKLALKELIRANQTKGYGSGDESFPLVLGLIGELILNLENNLDINT